MSAEARRVWGIAGGMGPIASAEFVNAIYSRASGVEQAMPALILHSDPSYPARTEALLRGEHVPLARRLEASISTLHTAGATDIVIACMTAHSVLAYIDERLRRHVWSLVDVLLNAVRDSRGNSLLLCSNGCRHTRVYENHPLWTGVVGQLVLPHDADQEQIHRLITEIKANAFTAAHLEFLEWLRRRYGVDGLVAGCTEFHVVSRRHGNRTLGWIDPLDIMAARIALAGAALPATVS